jgi:hypothetical protein
MKEFIEKLISKLKAGIDKECVSSVPKIRLCDAISLVNELAEEYNNGWIACSERLPEEDKPVLFCTKDKKISQGVRVSYYGHQRYNLDAIGKICWDSDSIIAWQPLPEPYKEGGEADE